MTAKQIAIDGPAGAGKSTIAKLVADQLGYLYIDTGAMYRAIAWLAIQQGLTLDDEEALVALAQQADIRLTPASGGCEVWCGDRNISQDIRRPEIGDLASPISAISGVRRVLVRLQREMAAGQPVVMDGRDIGTVVLPDADCKIYLTAESIVRARRRTAELLEKGIDTNLEEVEKQLQQRDYQDSHRSDSPLRQAEGSVLIDSSEMTISQVVEAVLSAAEGKR